MSTSGLIRVHSLIKIWERISLPLAAETHGDDSECRRFFHPSSLRRWCFSEHLLAEHVLDVLALIYISQQLWRLDDSPRSEDWLLTHHAPRDTGKEKS